jgi:hypothetical protein
MAKETEVEEAAAKSLAIPDDPKSASRFVVDLFRTKAIYAPGLTFENPRLSDEEKAEMSELISEQRHTASSLEELLEGSKLLAGKDYLNRPFKISNVAWRASTIAGEGLPIFAILTIVLPDGTEKKVGTGATSVVESVALGDAADWFGVSVDKEWLKFTGVDILDEDRKKTGRTAVELHTAGDLAPFQ